MTRLTNRLRFAILTACAARGDGDAYMAELLEDSAALADASQIELAEHFESEARLWSSAGLSSAPGPSQRPRCTGDSRPDLGLFSGVPKGVV